MERRHLQPLVPEITSGLFTALLLRTFSLTAEANPEASALLPRGVAVGAKGGVVPAQGLTHSSEVFTVASAAETFPLSPSAPGLGSLDANERKQLRQTKAGRELIARQ